MTDTDARGTGPESQAIPDGEYAIVEMMGHRTMVGRITEIERFGTNMLSIEPLLRDTLLPAVLTTGASIYQLTPCSKEVAQARQPKNEYSLPTSVAAALPPAMLPSPDERPAFLHTSAEPAFCGVCGGPFGSCDCVPF
jgi:hypothetical protein